MCVCLILYTSLCVLLTISEGFIHLFVCVCVCVCVCVQRCIRMIGLDYYYYYYYYITGDTLCCDWLVLEARIRRRGCDSFWLSVHYPHLKIRDIHMDVLGCVCVCVCVYYTVHAHTHEHSSPPHTKCPMCFPRRRRSEEASRALLQVGSQSWRSC